jgi:sec-independent protein translocase protein TatC
MDEKSMPFLEHLEELRRVLLKSFLAVVAGTGACLFFSPQLYRFLKAPLQQVLPANAHFIATTPFESYMTYFKVSLLFGLFLASPLVFYYFWRFVRPGLHSHESRGIVPLALICSLLFVGGALFGYFVVFPPGFQFAVGILHDTDILLFPKMSEYLSFALRLLLAFGLIFELPLLLWLMGRLGVVDARQLRRARKYIIVVIFLIAGILTPGPDVLSQLLMAAPLWILFETGILLVRFWGAKDKISSERLEATEGR